jgi:hypothetical protein
MGSIRAKMEHGLCVDLSMSAFIYIGAFAGSSM